MIDLQISSKLRVRPELVGLAHLKVDFLRIVCCSNEHYLCVNEPLAPAELLELTAASSAAAAASSGLFESECSAEPSGVSNAEAAAAARESRARAFTSASVASSALSTGAGAASASAAGPDVDEIASQLGVESDSASVSLSFASSQPADPVALLRCELELSTQYRRRHPLVALLLVELAEASSFQYAPTNEAFFLCKRKCMAQQYKRTNPYAFNFLPIYWL